MLGSEQPGLRERVLRGELNLLEQMLNLALPPLTLYSHSP